MSQQYLVWDAETRSEVDLKRCGAFEYSKHASTQILCLSWAFGTLETIEDVEIHSYSSFLPKKNPAYGYHEFLLAIEDPKIIKVAQNAFFEQVLTQNLLHLKVDPRFWLCTASLAAAQAIPRSLEGAALALNLKHKKDMEGRRLVLKYCKPRKATKNNSYHWHNKVSDLKKIIEYNKQDVRATIQVLKRLPALSLFERHIWELDQEINHRGFNVDRDLVKRILTLIELERSQIAKRTFKLSEGKIDNVTQRNKVLEWLQFRGVQLQDLTAKSVEGALLKYQDGPIHEMLLNRQSAARSSTAKYQAFEMRTRSDGICRDHMVYHTATTGRWGSHGVQVQNFFRSKFKADILEIAIQNIKEGFDLEDLRLIFGVPMELFASLLKGMIVPHKGRRFFCGDYASVETRILFWMAGHTVGLKAYYNKEDLYKQMAAIIYNKKDLKTITDDERQVGKRAILGCGYGMSWKKFKMTCEQYGDPVSDELAQKAVYSYRNFHAPIPKMWRNLEDAAKCALLSPGKVFATNKVKWVKEKNALYCTLPSGRRLSYWGAQIKYDMAPWGEKVPKIYHWGTNPKTKKWEFNTTYYGNFVENIVQATARDLMAEAMLRTSARGYKIVLSVHDELLAEHESGSVEEFKSLMKQIPLWANGCPIEVEGWGPEDRYHK